MNCNEVVRVEMLSNANLIEDFSMAFEGKRWKLDLNLRDYKSSFLRDNSHHC